MKIYWKNISAIHLNTTNTRSTTVVMIYYVYIIHIIYTFEKLINTIKYDIGTIFKWRTCRNVLFILGNDFRGIYALRFECIIHYMFLRHKGWRIIERHEGWWPNRQRRTPWKTKKKPTRPPSRMKGVNNCWKLYKAILRVAAACL